MVFDRDTAEFVVGVIGNIIAFILFVSPLPTIINICKKKSVEQFSPMLYLATFLHCGIRILYALPYVQPHKIHVLTTHATGSSVEVVFLILFSLYSERNKRIKIFLIFLGEVIFMISLTVPILTVVHEKRSVIVGIISIVTNILMYASPMTTMRRVIITKSVEYMPFLVSFSSLLCSSTWAAYALIRFDIYILISSIIGMLLSLIQLLLYAMYYKSTKRQIADRKGRGEQELTERNTSNNYTCA
ncbi:bidirectional sugar transporter SWEET7-like [Nicotiana tomentosiformis]|uniref:bidirectional sugar transporter SWEET7-like n=1 Tax=Nicotiana tomentosiformis TaxID=4098 RepID=UPI00388CB23F